MVDIAMFMMEKLKHLVKIFWDRYDGFYRECRSVVIDIEKECIVLCPFSKFFNINELEETSIENIQKE